MDTLTTDLYGTFDLPSAICDVNKSIGDAECSVIDRMGTYAQDNFKNQSDIAGRSSAEFNVSQALQTKVLTDNAANDALQNAIAIKDVSDKAAINLTQMTSFERDIQNRIHENRWLVTKEIHDQADLITARQADSFTDIKNQLRNLELDQAKQFGELKYENLKGTTSIIEKLGADKYDNMKDKIDALREECEGHKYRNAFATQSAEISSLKQMINSVDQNQRFSSKTVQFGTGNTSGTNQTANQGWSEGPDLNIVLKPADSNLTNLGKIAEGSLNTTSIEEYPELAKLLAQDSLGIENTTQIISSNSEIVVNNETIINNIYEDDDCEHDIKKYDKSEHDIKKDNSLKTITNKLKNMLTVVGI